MAIEYANMVKSKDVVGHALLNKPLNQEEFNKESRTHKLDKVERL